MDRMTNVGKRGSFRREISQKIEETGLHSPGDQRSQNCAKLTDKIEELRVRLNYVGNLWQNVNHLSRDPDSKLKLVEHSLVHLDFLTYLAEACDDPVTRVNHSSVQVPEGRSPESADSYMESGRTGQIDKINEKNSNCFYPGDLKDRCLQIAKSCELYINYSSVSEDDRKILRKFRRQFQKDPSVEFLLRLSAHDLVSQPGWGRKSVTWLRSFQKRMLHLIGQFDLTKKPELYSPASVLVSHRLMDLSPEYIDWALMYDFDHLLSGVGNELRSIAMSRWAYRCEHQSLEEIGGHLGKTRERVRQLESGFNELLPTGMRIAPAVLRHNLDNYQETLFESLLPGLSSCFTKKRYFYEFLDLCAKNAGEGSWLKNQWVEVSQISYMEIEVIFASHQGPLSQVMMSQKLQEQFQIKPVQADQVMSHFINIGKIAVKNGYLQPVTLRKNVAVAWVLLDYPNGLHWADVYQELRKRQLLKSHHQEERLDASFTENERIFLIDQGTYCHKRFLELNSKLQETLIRLVRQYLSKKPSKTANLQAVWVNVSQSVSVDYFILRYVVSNPGAKKGLFFDGASRNDTVSLLATAKRQTFKHSILDIIEAEGRPLSVDEISQKIRRKSSNIVSQQLQALRSAGKLVMVGNNQYDTPGRV